MDAIVNFFPSHVLTWPRYEWAARVLDSRYIWWDGTRHLVPMLDFINCRDRVQPQLPPLRVHSTKMDDTGLFANTRAGDDGDVIGV